MLGWRGDWPKLWHNLRATRETELAEQYPSHVACAWIGNSVQVAAKHYLQVTEDHFTEAAQNATQQATAPGRIEAHSTRKNRTETHISAA